MFSTAPRFTEVIIGALRADGSTDLAVYVPAVLAMGAAGQTGLVLTSWASILAWAHGDGATALHADPADGPLAPGVRTHAVRLIDSAATGHAGIVLRETVRSARELGAQGTWDLISCLARPMRTVLDTVGDHARLLRCIDLIAPAATSEDLPHLAGPLGLTLAAISRNRHHAAHRYLTHLTATATTGQVLAILLRTLATTPGEPALTTRAPAGPLAPHTTRTHAPSAPPHPMPTAGIGEHHAPPTPHRPHRRGPPHHHRH